VLLSTFGIPETTRQKRRDFLNPFFKNPEKSNMGNGASDLGGAPGEKKKDDEQKKKKKLV
jgi:hypothetical protein